MTAKHTIAGAQILSLEAPLSPLELERLASDIVGAFVGEVVGAFVGEVVGTFVGGTVGTLVGGADRSHLEASFGPLHSPSNISPIGQEVGQNLHFPWPPWS